MTTKVWVVGPEEALKTNQWLAMTNNHDAALELLVTLEGATTIKEVEVKKPYVKNRGRNNRS